MTATSGCVLAAAEVRAAARSCGFALVGLAPAEPLDSTPLRRWLEQGYAAGLSSMRHRLRERLDPGAVVPGARTVLVLGIPYGPGDSQGDSAPPAVIARYARGRDYHHTHRDRMRLLRGHLRRLLPSLRTYACVDAGAAMEKAWAERAGLGFIGKNGVVISTRFGSWFTLSLMVLDCDVDGYDTPHPRQCGTCEKCLTACPTSAFPSPGVLDARRCLSYHTVENHAEIPSEIAPRLGTQVFGCDICQAVCPFNRTDLPAGDPRQAPRPLGHMDAAVIAALSEGDFAQLASGTAMRRIGYHGLRRNACLSLGATRAHHASTLLARLAGEDTSALVRDAAAWALARLREA